jgi:hypothetical protein
MLVRNSSIPKVTAWTVIGVYEGVPGSLDNSQHVVWKMAVAAVPRMLHFPQ